MSFSVVYGRNKRNTNHLFQPTHYPVANFYTNTHKKSEMNSFGDQLFLNNLHLIPDPLKKNLADTLIPQEKATSRITETKSELSRGEYSPLTGISNFFSGVFNMLTNAMSRPKSPVIYYDCSDTDECRQGSPWQSANTEELNRNDQADMLDTPTNVDSNMSSGYRTVVQCENKLNKVRSLLSNKGTKPTRLKNRVKKVFVEPGSVEDSFEDAFTFEELISIENNTYIEYNSPLQYQNQELLEIDAPKIKSEMGPLSDSAKIVVEPEFTDKGKSCCNVNEPTASNDNDTKHQLVTSCEDKLSKLKALLQERRKKNTKTIVVTPSSVLEPDRIIEQPKKISKSIPINKTTDKRFKNSNRTCVDKRKKSKLRMNIHEDMMFANEINVDEQSSLENSPSLNSLDILNQKLANGNHADCFNEVSGRFCSTSTTDSEDSFQIVFNDIPTRLRRISDCDSEDSFIVFEDSPDSCYTSNDVFGDSEPECLDSDSELSDSGCLNMTSKLSHSLSKSVSNLTDDSLYINESEDEVDCTANICEPILNVVNYVSEKEGRSISKSGSLLDEQKKLLRKNMPAKRVQFSTQPPKVHVMRVWAFAARQARAGHWERYSLDRERFKRRIADVDMAVSWVLKPRHRSRVMFQRFMPWWNAQKRKELAEKKLRDEEEKLKNESLKKEQESTVIKTENVETYLRGEGIVDGEKICENGFGYTENECKIEETLKKNETMAEDKLETENGGKIKNCLNDKSDMKKSSELEHNFNKVTCQ